MCCNREEVLIARTPKCCPCCGCCCSGPFWNGIAYPEKVAKILNFAMAEFKDGRPVTVASLAAINAEAAALEGGSAQVVPVAGAPSDVKMVR